MEAIRRAGPADAETLARISREVFVAAFGNDYAPGDLAAFLEANYALEKAQAELSDPEIGVWFAEVGGEVVGYALAGPCKIESPEVRPGSGEVHRLYLLPEHQNGGKGARLMEAALDFLELNGRRPVYLGVWSENHGALRFYERFGFRKVGEHTFQVGSQLDREFTYRRG